MIEAYYTKHNDTQHKARALLWCVSLMLSVTYEHFVVSVVMLNAIMLNAIMLNVIMLNGFYAECYFAECHVASFLARAS